MLGYSDSGLAMAIRSIFYHRRIPIGISFLYQREKNIIDILHGNPCH